MKSVLTLLTLMLSVTLSYANTTISGKVADRKSRDAIEFVNVSAHSPEGMLLHICVTDNQGNFALNIKHNGTYTIKFTCIGYTAQSKSIECKGEAIDLGSIQLKPAVEELAAASISEKSIVRREADRIIYDVSADPDAHKMFMTEFMSKLPGLETSVASGKLEYQNRKIGKILIDDSDNPLINASRQYTMKFIKADYMSQMELILPHSPEYNNSEPMLVIRLSRALPFGMAAQLEGDASSKNSYDAKLDGVMNTSVVGVALNYDYRFTHEPSLSDKNVRQMLDDKGLAGDSGIETVHESRNKTQGHKLGMTLFRSFLQDKLQFNFSINTDRTTDDAVSSSKSTRTAGGNISENTLYTNNYSLSPFRFNMGFSGSYRWKKRNSVNFTYTFRDVENISKEFGRYDYGTDALLNSSTLSSRENNISADVRTRIIKQLSLNAQAGYMHRNYYNLTDYSGGSRSGMDYKQGVAYLRTSLVASFWGKKLNAAATLNMENVDNKGVNLSSGASLDYNEFHFVPSVKIMAIPWKMANVSVGYACNSRRPRQEMLNPYADYSDPNNIKVGNPELKGEITNLASVLINQDFKSKWFKSIKASARYSFTNNSIERYSFVNENNTMTTTYMNIGRSSDLNVSLGCNIRIASIANINLSGGAARRSYSISDKEQNSYWSFNASEMLMLKFKQFSIMQVCRFRPEAYSAQSDVLNFKPSLSITISRYWKKIRLETALEAFDLIYGRSSYAESSIRGLGFENYSYTQRRGRGIYLFLSWSIGKFKNTPAVEHKSYDM